MAKLTTPSMLLVLAASTFNLAHAASKPPADRVDVAARHTTRHTQIDHSGKKHRGKASYYSRKFAGKRMANGAPMNPNANVAASKTLPLGTKARVKNLRNGKSTVVDVEDRGPYVKDRIIDLSPKAAEQVGMEKKGVAPVEVTPIQVPQPTAGKTPQESSPQGSPGR